MVDEKKNKYYVKEGHTFGVNNLPEGSEVELTEAEYKAFEDLLEPADHPRRAKAAATKATKTPTKKETPKSEEHPT